MGCRRWRSCRSASRPTRSDLDTLALLARAFAAIGQAAKGIEVQKEMAKHRPRAGEDDLFRQLVEKLQRAAPNDETVRQLVAQARTPTQQPPPSSAPPRPNTVTDARAMPPPIPREPPRESSGASSSVPIEDLEYEAVETGDIEEAELEEAIPLRSDRPLPARAPRYEDDDAPELVVGEDSIPAEEYPSGEQAPVDVEAQLQQVLADASSFRRVRLYPKAVETLRIGLELEPRSLDVREMLRDVLLEAGLVEDAVLEMLDLAALYVEALDGDAAARCLQDVLAYDPPNARARQMLHELGYEVIDEPQDGNQDGQMGQAPEEQLLDEPPAPDAMMMPAEYAPSEPQRASAPSLRATSPTTSRCRRTILEEVGPADISEAYKRDRP